MKLRDTRRIATKSEVADKQAERHVAHLNVLIRPDCLSHFAQFNAPPVLFFPKIRVAHRFVATQSRRVAWNQGSRTNHFESRVFFENLSDKKHLDDSRG
jgi:hypothetical protein